MWNAFGKQSGEITCDVRSEQRVCVDWSTLPCFAAGFHPDPYAAVTANHKEYFVCHSHVGRILVGHICRVIAGDMIVYF